VQYEVETHEVEKRKKACGACSNGQTCNIVEEPPKCTPDPGVEGTACGSYKADKRDYACAKDLFCDRSASPWRCRPLAKVGEACRAESSCVEGLGCSWERHVCIEAHAEGERCHFADGYDDEAAYERCVDGLVCYRAERPPRCRAPAGEGKPCRNGIDCAVDLKCAIDADAGDLGTCVPMNAP
jgi:hypothetical protein